MNFTLFTQMHSQLIETFVSLCLKLMQALLKISSHFKMWKTMLTCFKLNTSALDFYKSIGFDIDANSPSVHGYDDECYEILSDKPKLK